MKLIKWIKRWRFGIIHIFFCLLFAALLLLICAQIPLVSETALWMLFILPVPLAIMAAYGEYKVKSGTAKPRSLWYFFEKNSLKKEGLGCYKKQKS